MDEAKLKAAVAGSPRARAAVLRALQDGWFAYAVAQLLSVSAARDATQEAGLRVLARLASFDPAKSVELWSMGAVVAAVREVRTLGGAAPPLLAAARAAGLPGDPPRYARQASDVADGLSAVLGGMTPDGREAVVLRMLDGRRTPAVAALVGRDPAAVRADVAAALPAAVRPGQRLRATLEGCRDWTALARYPGDLRAELFRTRRPSWLVPAAVASAAAGLALIGVAGHFRTAPVPTTPPTTLPSSRPGLGESNVVGRPV